MKNKFKKFVEEIVIPSVVLSAAGNLIAIMLGIFSLFTLVGGFLLVFSFICIGELIEYLLEPKKTQMEQFAETFRNVDKR